jgi:hypothetical protein
MTADQRRRAEALLGEASKRLDNAEKAMAKQSERAKPEPNKTERLKSEAEKPSRSESER